MISDTSRGIVDLLSAFLHEKEMISIGAQINHRWFKSNAAKEKIPKFNGRDDITRGLIELELLCEDLSYGAPKPVESIEHALKLFKKIEEHIEALRNEKN